MDDWQRADKRPMLRESTQEIRKMTTELLKAKKECQYQECIKNLGAFPKDRPASIDLFLLSYILFSKLELICQLEQGEEPWIKERQRSLGLCPGKHCSEDHRQQQEQLFDQICSSRQAEIQEREEDSKLLFRRISKSSTSKAISSPPEEQPVTSKEDNTVVDIGPNLAQRTDLEETDKILRGLEISRFGAIKYGKGFWEATSRVSGRWAGFQSQGHREDFGESQVVRDQGIDQGIAVTGTAIARLSISKPNMISLLEQGKEPWMVEREMSDGQHADFFIEFLSKLYMHIS
ncbi:hypothetical protein E5288_WYG020245 [Bos mutus]|uniref:KRAB domain-containing protein n=1 Tax=Bos mutus TaxID=72004 RepID=A0A6B0S557_9CETA|nr:hypothetical protein [Bos mutus]